MLRSVLSEFTQKDTFLAFNMLSFWDIFLLLEVAFTTSYSFRRYSEFIKQILCKCSHCIKMATSCQLIYRYLLRASACRTFFWKTQDGSVMITRRIRKYFNSVEGLFGKTFLYYSIPYCLIASAKLWWALVKLTRKRLPGGCQLFYCKLYGFFYGPTM